MSIDDDVLRSFNEKCDQHESDRQARKQPSLVTRCAAEIEPKRIDYLWPGRIARGKHTAIAGEPGDGKSQLSVFIAAMVTTGGEWPCGEGRAPVGNVIIFNAEDGADDTIVPRLIAAGADLKRVHIVNAVMQEDGKGRRSFNLQSDLALLEKKIAEIGEVALVNIDPVSSYMGKTDSHKNSEVRGALEPLSEMAERMRVAILSVTHFSKTGASNNGKALHRFIGSIAFVGAPRAAFAVIQDTENEGRMLLLLAKTNMGAKPQGLAYRLAQRIVGQEGEGIVASYVAFDSTPVTVSADEAMRASEDGSDREAAGEAEEFLRDKLSAGSAPAKEAEEDARALMIMPRTLRRARKKLGVISRRESEGRDGRGHWMWSLPSEGYSTPDRGSPLQGGHESCKAATKSNGPLAPKLAPLQANPTTQVVSIFGSAPPSSANQGRVTSASFHAVMTTPPLDDWRHLDIPDYLKRRLGAPAISAGPDDDLGDLH